MLRSLILCAGLALPSCAGGPELEGVPVAQVAQLLRGSADDVEAWDVNRNGLIDPPERWPLLAAIGQRIWLAILASNQAPEPDTDS